MRDRWYIETSAVNYLADLYEEHDALATRNYQKAQGRDWLMSPITFFELSLTRDEDRRDKILGYAKHLLSPYLAPSTEEIVVEFIRLGCPLFDRQDKFVSTMDLSHSWKNICEITELSFDYSQALIQPTAKLFRLLGELTYKVAFDREIEAEEIVVGYQITVEAIRRKLATHHRLFQHKSGDDHELATITIFLVYALFCQEITLHPEPFTHFWAAKNLLDEFARAEWLIDNHHEVFWRGPFIEMALAALSQFRTNTSRGLTFDIFHFVYLPYVKMFLTTDGHFAGVEELYPHPNMHKIIIVDEQDISEREFHANYPLERIKS